MIKKIDENTGREVRQITDFPHGARLSYFRREKHLPDGRIIGMFCADDQPPYHHLDVVIFDPETGDLEFPSHRPGNLVKVLDDGTAIYTTKGETRQVWKMRLPDGEPEMVGMIPSITPGKLGAPGIAHNVTCDGLTILLVESELLQPADPERPSDQPDDAGVFWRHIYRPRSGSLFSYNLDTESATECVHFDRYSFQHIDPSPVDPTLVKFAMDGLGLFEQRVWTVRTDGSDLKKIRPQRKGEWVHHEFWWPGGQYIGYKYVDRRNDWTIHELPWGELAPRPLQLGIADLTGREVYLSDPLCCFQSHLYVSPKADMISGEGTLNHSFVYAAPFSWSDYKIDLQPLATIHSPYLLSAAQSVECCFSADSKWLVYNDRVDGIMQIHAVKV